MQALAKTFGTGGDFGNKQQNIQMQQAVDNYVIQAIKDLQNDGTLPLDNPTLQDIDGQKVFNMLILPKLNALIKEKTGMSDVIKPDAGVVERFLADQVDYILINNFVKANDRSLVSTPAPAPKGGVGLGDDYGRIYANNRIQMF